MRVYRFRKRDVLGDAPVWRQKEFIQASHAAWSDVKEGSLIHDTWAKFENELGALMHLSSTNPSNS